MTNAFENDIPVAGTLTFFKNILIFLVKGGREWKMNIKLECWHLRNIATRERGMKCRQGDE